MGNSNETQGLLAGGGGIPEQAPVQEQSPLGQEPSNEPIDATIPDDDLFTRILVSGGEAIIYGEESGDQIAQLLQAGSDISNSIGLALSVLLSAGRNSLVEQGNAVPMDLIFMPQGAAEILGKKLGDLFPEEVSPQDIRRGVVIAKDMIMDTDAAASGAGGEGGLAQQAQMEAEQGMVPPQGGEMPPEQAGLLGGM